MKNFSIAMASFLIIMSPASYGSESLGTCSLRAALKADNAIMLPWVKEKNHFAGVTFIECINHARELHEKQWQIRDTDCASAEGPCYDRESHVSVRNVRYKFKSAEETIRGVLKI